MKDYSLITFLAALENAKEKMDKIVNLVEEGISADDVTWGDATLLLNVAEELAEIAERVQKIVV